jgi:hypothetical protein
VLSYVGNRFWTFRHRANHALLREWTVFFLLNAMGLVIAEATIGFTYYVLGFHGSLAFNLASVAGTGLGTIFRFWSYKKWVFIAPETLTGELPEQIPELESSGTPSSPSRSPQAASSRDVSPRDASPRAASSRAASPRSSSFRSGYAGAHRR